MAKDNAAPSFAEGMGQILHAIVNTLSAPDADIQFLTQLQGAIITKMKASGNPMMGAGLRQAGPQMGNPQPQAGQQQPTPMGASNPSQTGAPPSAPMGGIRAQQPMPSPDELRQALVQRNNQ